MLRLVCLAPASCLPTGGRTYVPVTCVHAPEVSVAYGRVSWCVGASGLGSVVLGFPQGANQALGCARAVSQARAGPLRGSNGHAQDSDLPRASHP